MLLNKSTKHHTKKEMVIPTEGLGKMRSLPLLVIYGCAHICVLA